LIDPSWRLRRYLLIGYLFLAEIEGMNILFVGRTNLTRIMFGRGTKVYGSTRTRSESLRCNILDLVFIGCYWDNNKFSGRGCTTFNTDGRSVLPRHAWIPIIVGEPRKQSRWNNVGVVNHPYMG
jgi:hypothetical protein